MSAFPICPSDCDWLLLDQTSTAQPIIDGSGPHDATVTALAQAVPYRWDGNPADQVPERRNRSVDIAISRRALMNDRDYCDALARKWREYSRTDASGPAPQAIAKCNAGDYASGITTLEMILTNDKVVLPPRYL